MKLPAFQFYPGDWMKDPKLRRCSAGARGVWMDVLCLMFECEPRGKLVTDGVTWTLQETAQIISGDTAENLRCLEELVSKGVMPQDENGAFYSKRLVRDELDREKTKNRVREYRSRNADVTPTVTPVKQACTEVEVEDEDTTTTKPKRTRKKFSFDGFHPETAEVVNHFLPIWPDKRKDGSDVEISRPQFADRISTLLSEGIAAPQLIAAGDMYLAENPSWPACPQFFFGKSEDAKYRAYLKMLVYQQSKVVNQ